MNRTIEALAGSFAAVEDVEALVLAGSTTSGLADAGSDHDLYAYTREAVPLEFRALVNDNYRRAPRPATVSAAALPPGLPLLSSACPPIDRKSVCRERV